MDENQLYQMIMGEYNNSQPANDYISAASANINNTTNARARRQLSELSTTGMGRSGIAGASLNDIYSNAGQQLSSVAANAEQMRMQQRQAMLGNLMGLYQYDQQNNPSFGQVLGGIGGTLAGSLLGPIGGAIGGKLGGLITGNNTFSNNYSPNSTSPTGQLPSLGQWGAPSSNQGIGAWGSNNIGIR